MFNARDLAEYMVVLIAAFSSHYSLPEAEVYRYLRRYDAIKMVHDFYDVMHTQPIDDMVESVAAYCRRKGGNL